MKAEQVLVDFCKNHTEEPFGRNLKRSEKFNICRYVKTQGETQLAEDVGQGNYMDYRNFRLQDARPGDPETAGRLVFKNDTHISTSDRPGPSKNDYIFVHKMHKIPHPHGSSH